MKLAVISFTRQGSICCGKLVNGFRDLGIPCTGYLPVKFLDVCRGVPGMVPVRQPVGMWTGDRFRDSDGIIFIGAAGIAVRAAAPYLRDKRSDPALVVADEQGTWAISLLSGHAGGANELARTVAELLGGTPVITTATDVAGKPAIDVLAVEAGLRLSDWHLAKLISAAVLEGDPVGFFSDFSWPEELWPGFTQTESCPLNVWITARILPGTEDLIGLCLPPGGKVLRLIPRIYCVGVGCRRGIPEAVITRAVTRVMEEHNLAPMGIAAVASIDIKQAEPGLTAAAGIWDAEFVTYSKDELNAVEGTFTPSPFVREITGTDNVCERAALACAGAGGGLLVSKQAADGVTVAVAKRPWIKELK